MHSFKYLLLDESIKQIAPSDLLSAMGLKSDRITVLLN
jgi:hypothetical protein